MNYFVAIFVLIISNSAMAGKFVQKNLYSTAHLAVGTGKSRSEAQKDAEQSIPAATKTAFYEPDSGFNSPQYQCVDGVIWTDKDECWGGDIQLVIPLRYVTR